MTDDQKAVFEKVLPELAAFKRAFRRDPTLRFIAELYAAKSSA
jgi:hypothetical protein